MASLSSSLVKIYLATALVLMNTLAAFVVMNFFLAAAFYILDAATSQEVVGRQEIAARNAFEPSALFNADGSPINNGKRSDYQLGWFDFNAYENIEPIYAGEVLDDFYELSRRGFIYQPWVQFSEPPFQGKHVNVDLDERGIPARRTVNSSNVTHLPVIRIFTLGGSTTFGYNVSDGHTWPSYLAKILNDRAQAQHLGVYVEVVNYGRGFFYPTQETVLAMDLLKSGHRPSLMIFMDGVNPGPDEDVPTFTDKFERQLAERQFTPETPIVRQLQWVPVVRLTLAIQKRILGSRSGVQARRPDTKIEGTIDHRINRFIQDRKIAEGMLNQYAVRSLFFLQPDAVHNYPLVSFRNPVPDDFLLERGKRVVFYKRMSATKGVTDLSNLFQDWGIGRKAIVDDCHYSPSFNHFLAEQVAKHIALETLVPRDKLIDDSSATGIPRVVRSYSD
jgi:hypothetical protein